MARRIESALIVGVMLVGAFSLWTVIPLGWLWIGSQLVGTQEPRLWAYFLVLVGIIISVVIVAKILAALNRRWVALQGLIEDFDRKIPMPWMESMRDERHTHRETILDRVLVASALMAGFAALLWFFIAAESPLPSA